MSGRALVAGAGVAGLTMALLLAKFGKKVTLIEKQSEIGGYLRRFSRSGCRFDTGFHFSGGFDSVFPRLLRIMGLQDDVTPRSMRMKICLNQTGTRLTLPGSGVGDIADFLAGIYPGDAVAIRKYFEAEQRIWQETPMADMHETDRAPVLRLSADDSVTLQEFLKELHFSNPELETILGIMTVCHGTPPDVVPLSHHCRVSRGLWHHLSCVERGGDAFLTGFERELKRRQVEICTDTTIRRMIVDDNAECSAVELSDGRILETDEVYFAFHPDSILKLLPEKYVGAGLRRRVEKFQETCSFCTIYGIIDGAALPAPELMHYIHANDLNRILRPGAENYATGMIITPETGKDGKTRNLFTAFRTFFPQDAVMERGPGYDKFKAEMKQALLQDIRAAYPEYADRLTVLDVATPLTYRDYAPPSGSAYGVFRKISESRLPSVLPVGNCYTVGQSSLVPGVLGVIMGAFLRFRQNIGEDAWRKFLEKIS